MDTKNRPRPVRRRGRSGGKQDHILMALRNITKAMMTR